MSEQLRFEPRESLLSYLRHYDRCLQHESRMDCRHDRVWVYLALENFDLVPHPYRKLGSLLESRLVVTVLPQGEGKTWLPSQPLEEEEVWQIGSPLC